MVKVIRIDGFVIDFLKNEIRSNSKFVNLEIDNVMSNRNHSSER